ncbi:cell wall hydrolase [Tropicimonas sp. IMCC6043]|uniref:cell wall hydrolase n=1 Tax=Tropicimonas sp. IMCC6043 TaxID=2510645 RepID=UPI00101BE998|nr:cell wall hydrolase [Tropicimonas sp. IMCC6043]RYH09193.1 hypothetical protein EU800_13370 [Tropicimonas sp. IMCC6043]
MRIAASISDDFPQLGGAIEGLSESVAANPALREALEAACAGRLDKLDHALGYPTNPWIALAEPGEIEGSDPRGHYISTRRNTIVLARGLAEALDAGGEEAMRAVTVAALRGLVHWIAGTEWITPDAAPGQAFEAALLAQPLAPPTHDAPATTAEPVQPAADDGSSPVAFRLGAAILDIARRHIGQRYAFSPTPDYDDPNWSGPFDCAEYASYCAWRAYRIPYGVNRDPQKRFNSYSGYWQRDAVDRGLKIAWRDALQIPGAILLRFPPRGSPPPYGHVAISLGNGGDTYEAHGRARGVCQHNALNRSWDCAVLLPGVLYDLPDGIGSDLLVFKLLDPPAGHSPIVERAQTRLVELSLLVERQVNGIYDAATADAVAAFQEDRGLAVDGELGPETGRALGLGEIWEAAPVADRPALAAAPPVRDAAIEAEILTLARTLYGEARGEPREGQEAVANVILNRVRSARYPNTIAKVCLQRWQFSCWNESDPNRRVIEALEPGANPVFDALLEIAAAAVFGRLPVRVAGALHYYASSIAQPRWVRKSPGATLVATIGRHLFWSGIR